MTISDLKQLIKDLPDDMQVFVPIHPMEPFTGHLFTPCIEESGVSSSPVAESEDEYNDVTEKVSLGIPVEEQQDFLLVPCGYFSKHSELDVQQN